VVTCRTSARVIPPSGTFMRRDQGVFVCPAYVPTPT
jgi:hypothetical protein